MGILDWLLGRGKPAAGPGAGAVEDAVERIVDTANPRLRFAARYAQRLGPAVQTAMAYAAELVSTETAVREATAAGWAADPCMRAFFVTPDDIVRAFSRSIEVRGFFDEHPLADEVYAVIGMRMEERRISGMALEGSVIRRDVEQTTVSFGDHRVRLLGETEADLRAEIERRIIDQLVMDGVSRAAAEQGQREAVEQERALLKARLRLLEQGGAGMRAALGGGSDGEESVLDKVRSELEANTRTLEGLAPGAERLDAELERIVEALKEARERFSVTTTRLLLDRMNVIQTDATAESTVELAFQSVRIPADPPETRAFVFARFPRTDLLPATELRAEAARHLI